MPQMSSALIVAVFPILVVYAAATDFFTMTIGNRVSFGLLVAGVLALALQSPSLAEVGWHFAAAGAVLGVGFVCFACRWIGGGDVKFATAIAFWLGWSHVLDFAVGFSLYGGLLTLLVLLFSRILAPLPTLKVGFLATFDEKRRVPYGIALSAAALQVFSETSWMQVFV